ncbi:conserved hypothetical protein [Gammaproteobacteria bacterium]
MPYSYNYSLSIDDMQDYLATWFKNPDAISAQVSPYPQDINPLERLANDHSNPLRLSANGEDGEPVLDHDQATIKRYSDNKSSRAWPTDEGLVRLGQWIGLPPERVLLLILKVQCETGFADEIYQDRDMKGPLISAHHNLEKILEGEIVDGYSYLDYAKGGGEHWKPAGGCRNAGFRLGLGQRMALEEIFSLLQQYQLSDGYDLDLFESMVDSALHNGLFLCRPQGPEIIRFVSHWRGEIAKRDGASSALRDRHHVARLNLRAYEREYDDLIWENDRLSFEIEGTHVRYYVKLGDLEVRQAELVVERERLTRQIALKEADPTLTREQCAQCVDGELQDTLLELERQRNLNKEGLGYQIFGPQGGGRSLLGTPIVDREESAAYEQECRRLIVEIERLALPLRKQTHPDGRVGRDFAPEQMVRLDGYFHTALGHIDRLKQVKGTELSLGNRSLDHLKDIRTRVEEIVREVEAIYAQEGFVVSLKQLPPEGASLPELCDWLETHAKEVEQDIRTIKDLMMVRRKDDTYRYQDGVLASEASIAAAREKLQAAIGALEDELPPLRESLNALFG